MIEKRCIIIDDEPQDASIENLVEALRKDGISLNCLQLNPKDKEFRKNIGTIETPNYAIDIDLVLAKLSTHEYFKRRVDLIACDYNLEDDEINGFEIITTLRIDSYKHEIILYSGSLETVIDKILDEQDRAIQRKKIKKLAASNISHITDRSDYKETIIGCIRNETFSLGRTIEQLLEPLEELEFKSIPHEFKGKKVKEILDEIKAETNNGIKFQKAILEFAISNLIELNDDK